MIFFPYAAKMIRNVFSHNAPLPISQCILSLESKRRSEDARSSLRHPDFMDVLHIRKDIIGTLALEQEGTVMANSTTEQPRRRNADEAREERRNQATKHEGLMKGAFAKDTEETIAAAIIYEEGEGRELPLPDPAPFEATETVVTTSFAPEAIRRYGQGKIAVVDPASFTRPGGAYEDGAFGPEQILCSESNLYQILRGIRADYHDKNKDYRRGMLFTDRAVYLPEVMFLQGGNVKKADVIVIAEPVRARALENHRSERECDNELAGRVETMMRIAAAQEAETLVMGAFACGRNGYDTAQVIGLLRAWIEAHPGAIKRIVFAVPRAFVDDFRAAFDPEEEAAPTPEIVEEDVGEEEDWRSVELPEGVTLR